MNKSLTLSLNRYAVIPNKLRIAPGRNTASGSISVDLAQLFHHYYLDTYGRVPPDPDPAHFEHARFLMPTSDFRFVGGGLGVSPASKRSRSTELGQAFCRLFLHEHLNITYFAHLESILNRQLIRAFNGCHIVRTSTGDTPDYFCAESVHRFYLAEAKGRYDSISFASAEFNSWRQQFCRVELRNSRNAAVPIKGHIVATRFATETRPRVSSGLYAEDPESPGEAIMAGEDGDDLGSAIIGLHYSNIAEKLNQSVLAAALANGLPLPEILGVPATLWELTFGPYAGLRFVGGYYQNGGFGPMFQHVDDRLRIASEDGLRLDVPRGTFFGVEESIFRAVISVVRGSGRFSREFPIQPEATYFYSGVSMLRDGTVIAPIEFFVPVEFATY